MTYRDRLLEIRKEIEDKFSLGLMTLDGYMRQMANIEMALDKYPINGNNDQEYVEDESDGYLEST